jgi:hypothetical protein
MKSYIASNLQPGQQSIYTTPRAVRFPTQAKDFSLLESAQIGCAAHPASYSISTRRSPLSSAEVKIGGAIFHPPIGSHGVNTCIISYLLRQVTLHVRENKGCLEFSHG